LRCEPGLAAAHLWTAIVHMDLEEYEKSVASLDRAVELGDTTAEVLHRRAMAKHCFGRLREAVRDYSETLRTAGVDAQVYYHRGLAYAELSEYLDAISDYTKALELFPQLCDAYYARSIAWEKLGQLDRATDDLNQCLAISQTRTEP